VESEELKMFKFKFGARQEEDRVKDREMRQFETTKQMIGQRARGEVINFTKSFGFISWGRGKPDLFFHFSDVKKARETGTGYKTFRPGDRVEFTISENPRRSGKFKATDVSLLDSENAVAV
jgi:cold shock CspA family protein